MENDNKKYMIVGMCNPYNARTHYHMERVLEYDMTTPTKWVVNDDYGYGLSYNDAINILASYANEIQSMTLYNDSFIKELKTESLLYDEIFDDSWYEGEGWYIDNQLVFKHGDTSIRDDVMLYRIEEFIPPSKINE